MFLLWMRQIIFIVDKVVIAKPDAPFYLDMLYNVVELYKIRPLY